MSYISDLIWHVTAKRGNVSEEITGRWQNNSAKQICPLGNICNEVLDSQTLSDEKFCFLGNVCYQYLNFMLLAKLIAADWPQSTSLKMYCYISVIRLVNFVSVARLR